MSKHLKRLNAPRALKLHRKQRKWTVKPDAGPHPLETAIPLGLIVRDYLNLTDTMREAKRVISIPKMKKDYRILYDRRGKLILVPVQSKDAKWKLCRIENKTILKKKQIQLNLHDGMNKLVKKDEYKTGDVLKISFKDKKIDDVYKLEKGTLSVIIGGSHIGETANIQDIEIIPSSKPNLAKMKGEKEFTTLQNYVFPIGKNKPVISLPEVKIQ